MKKSPKLARLSGGVCHIVSSFVPQTLGGSPNNIYNFLFAKTISRLIYVKNHAPLWNWLREHPSYKNILEIGFGDGSNADEMIRIVGGGCYYFCFDLLDPTFLRFISDKRKRERIFNKINGRGNVRFFAGDSRETLLRYAGELPMMDLIFIDGGHEYDICKSDWENCKQLMHPRTAVFFHDYDLEGVKKTVDEIGDGFSIKVIDPGVGPLFALVRRLS